MVDRVFFILPYNYRFQDNWPEAAASANEFVDVAQCDSDREIEELNDTEILSDCLSASEQSCETESDINNHGTDSDIDPEYITFPISFTKADEVCVRLNDLIQSGRIPKDKILYKYLNSITYAMINPNHEFDEEVVQFFNSIKFLGGERTVNFVRGPMWHGCGKGGELSPECAKPNLGGPSRTTRNKRSSGYTTKSGVVKPWFDSFLQLLKDTLDVKPLVETTVLKVYGVAMENDSTALKPAIQYDEKQQINVGLKDRADIVFVASNPDPKLEFLKENIVSEANVCYLSTANNNVAMPVGVRYKPKAGKTGEEMKQQFLEEVDILQTCHCCVKAASSNDHILEKEAMAICRSHCDTCISTKSVCPECREKGQTSFRSSLRACQRCLEAGHQCVRAAVLVIVTDCESGNKKAFELIAESRMKGTLDSRFMFICLPDAVHVGKSLKCNFANWTLLLREERACLSMLHTIRNADPNLKKILPRDSVLNKDRMDVDCVLHLSKGNVLLHLESIDHVVHSIVPDSYRISETNKIGMYPHPIAVCVGDRGKILVLDYAPVKNSSRLLEVRLHVPADVKILGEYLGATSMVYSGGITYLCLPTGIQTVPIAAKTRLQVKALKKTDLISELLQRGLPQHGTVQVLGDRLENYLKNLEKAYKERNIDLTMVYLSERIKPSCVAKASESILVCSSDVDEAIYMITLEMDGVVVKGNVNVFSRYPDGCKEVVSMCVNENILYVSHKGVPGGVAAIKMTDLMVDMILKNGTLDCVQSSHVAPYKGGIVFVDTEGRQIKAKIPSQKVTVIAGTGSEGNSNGKAENARFSQPMGICVECDKNIFVTDAQTGAVKLVTTIKGTVEFLRHLGLLYKAFSIHLKHQKAEKLSLDEAISKLETLDHFLKETVQNVTSIFEKPCKPSGPIGTVSSQTLSSVSMILEGLRALEQLLKELNPDYKIDLHTCLTVQVENLHAIGHFKEQFPTLLQYAQNLANTVYESIKRVVQWAAYYYTHEKSYYPVVGQAMPLNALPRMSHLKPARKLNDRERESMLEWAANNGKAVRQRTVRQETTMFKAGTLPLNMYATSEQPKEKITMERTLGHVDAAGDLGCPVEVVESNRKREEEENQKDTDDEQESEYDTESESELPATVDSDLEDEMTFLRAVTTRSGRTIRVTSKFF